MLKAPRKTLRDMVRACDEPVRKVYSFCKKWRRRTHEAYRVYDEWVADEHNDAVRRPVQFCHSLAGPVKKHNRKITQPHLPVLVDVRDCIRGIPVKE